MVTSAGAPSSLAAARRLHGTVAPPSDKSISHRALIAAALAVGVSEVRVQDPGADIRATGNALAVLGVPVSTTSGNGSTSYAIEGRGAPGSPGMLAAGEADCANSGTTMRLLAGVAAASPAPIRLIGDASLSGRPMERVAVPLRVMGADISTVRGHAPLDILGARPLRASAHHLPVASAQMLAAICLAALAAEGETVVHVPGPTRDHTERLLAWLGVPIAREEDPEQRGSTVTILRGPVAPRGRDVSVPGDPSASAAWLVAGAIHPDAELRILGVTLNPSRLALVDVLREMGAAIEVLPDQRDPTGEAADQSGGEPVGDLVVRGGRRLRGVRLTGARVAPLIDELPLLAVAMAAADGRSELADAGELRIKESDRIATMVRALHAAGSRIEERHDGWRIERGRPQVAEVKTEGDHRIAMAMAVAAWTGVARGVSLDDPHCVGVSYPGFWRDAAALGVV